MAHIVCLVLGVLTSVPVRSILQPELDHIWSRLATNHARFWLMFEEFSFLGHRQCFC